MKNFILIVLMVLAFIVNTPEAHALFGHTAEERQRRIATEQQLSQEQQKVSEQEQRLLDQQHHVIEQQKVTARWQTIAFVLGLAAVFTLIIGTAIGSQGRHHAAKGE